MSLRDHIAALTEQSTAEQCSVGEAVAIHEGNGRYRVALVESMFECVVISGNFVAPGTAVLRFPVTGGGDPLQDSFGALLDALDGARVEGSSTGVFLIGDVLVEEEVVVDIVSRGRRIFRTPWMLRHEDLVALI